jgi:RNA polymerase primary sigma factor
MNLPVEKIKEWLRVVADPVSLEAPTGEQDRGSLAEFLIDNSSDSPSDSAAKALVRARIQDVLHTLGEREREVISLRYGLTDGRPHTLEEVAQAFQLTRERIRQIEQKSLKKLKHPSRASRIREVLDEPVRY